MDSETGEFLRYWGAYGNRPEDVDLGNYDPDAPPEQQYIYLADGQNRKIYVMDREDLEVLYSFGDGVRQPGQFYGVHSIGTDSQSNIYTTETWEGKRLQKFVYTGMGRVERGSDQGVLWPRSDRGARHPDVSAETRCPEGSSFKEKPGGSA